MPPTFLALYLGIFSVLDRDDDGGVKDPCTFLEPAVGHGRRFSRDPVSVNLPVSVLLFHS